MSFIEAVVQGVGLGLGTGIGTFLATKYAIRRIEHLEGVIKGGVKNDSSTHSS